MNYNIYNYNNIIWIFQKERRKKECMCERDNILCGWLIFQFLRVDYTKLITECDFTVTHLILLSVVSIHVYNFFTSLLQSSIVTLHVLRSCMQTVRYVTAPCENNEACQDDALAFYSSENNECLAFSHAILRPYRLNKGSCSFSRYGPSCVA